MSRSCSFAERLRRDLDGLADSILALLDHARVHTFRSAPASSLQIVTPYPYSWEELGLDAKPQ